MTIYIPRIQPILPRVQAVLSQIQPILLILVVLFLASVVGRWLLGGIILLPVLTRVFSAEDYGLIDMFAASVSLLALFLRLALPSAINRYFHDLSEPSERQALVSSSLFLVAGLAAAVAWFSASR